MWIGGSAGLTVGLAHRRLSIIDLSTAGHQPMTNEDGSMWLTYNGEVYNHADLRAELEPAGHTYRSHTDSETIIHAFEEWGDRGVEHFRGMFAFAFWDQARGGSSSFAIGSASSRCTTPTSRRARLRV